MIMDRKNIKLMGITFFLIFCFCYILNINATTLVCCFVSLIIGASIGSGIIVNADEIQGIIDRKLKKKYVVEKDMVNGNKKKDIKRNRYDENMLFYVEEELNGKIELFLERIIERYINSWYLSEFENDTAFIGEIRHHCCYAGRKILSLIKKTDFEGVIIEEVFPQILLHFQRMGNCNNIIKEDKSTLCEFFGIDSHYVLRGNLNSQKYMNILSEKILRKIIDVKRISGKVGDNNGINCTWPSKTGLYLLQDLVTNFIFSPLIEFLSEPDNINKLFLSFVDGSPSNDIKVNDENKKEVMFLHGLEEQIHSTIQDSLLQVKLGKIIKDPRLLQTFEIFLEDFNGPLALLQILKSLDGIHKTLIKIEKVDDSEMVLREIEFDLHQIYATWKVFVNENEKEIIRLNTLFLNESMFKELKKDLDNKNIHAIDKVIEEAYRKVYEILSKNFVVPFSQSECFFGYLCCSSPFDVDQFQLSNNTLTVDNINSSNYGKIPENSLSFASFRKRVWSVMVPNSSTGSDINDDIEDECYELAPSVETPIDTAEYNNLGILTILKSNTKLSIRIEDIEMRRDSIASRMYYVYAIAVISTDISTPEPTSVEWTVLRKPEEFYTLQQKLLEKHGSAMAQFQSLPPKKSITSRDKIVLLENLHIFESFLNDINHHSLLQKSDLFFNFLSAPDEFKDSLTLSELNPWRIVKKVPQKLSREKGQNLKSFILNSLANLLAPPSSNIYSYYGRSHSNFDTFSFNDNMSSSSIGESELLTTKYKNNIINNKNKSNGNIIVSKNDGISCVDECLSLSSNIDKNVKPNFYNTLLAFLLDIISLPNWILYPLLFIEYLFSNVISSYITHYLTNQINLLLIPSTFSNLISSLHSTVFDSNYEIVTTEEKNLRRQLARRKFKDISLSVIPLYGYFKMDLKKYEHSIENIFDASQCQELNKQLVIVVLDKIIDNLFNK